MNSRVTKETGFSLVELMIAMALGLFLIGGVTGVFLSSSKTYRLQDSMSRIQESGRFASNYLAASIREAGYGLDRSDIALQGYDSVPTLLPSGWPAKAAKAVGDVIHITDHENTDRSMTFFVAEDVGQGNRALFRNSDALVEGVEAIEFSYGIDDHHDYEVDRHVPAAAVDDWTQVIAVRAALLVSSPHEGVVDTAKSFPASSPFATFDTSDKRLYQTWFVTTALRNRLP